jgi:hypothetical protein
MSVGPEFPKTAPIQGPNPHKDQVSPFFSNPFYKPTNPILEPATPLPLPAFLVGPTL